jgi:hypothetical protein
VRRVQPNVIRLVNRGRLIDIDARQCPEHSSRPEPRATRIARNRDTIPMTVAVAMPSGSPTPSGVRRITRQQCSRHHWHSQQHPEAPAPRVSPHANQLVAPVDREPSGRPEYQ